MKRLIFEQVRFMTSCVNWRDCPITKDDQGKQLYEIAVAGRSNVGKSSLLNHLFKSKDLVKTSQRPGKTQLLNFFEVDKVALFCDLPGYGYAKVSEDTKDLWQNMIDPYIERRESLKLVLLLLDIRREPSEQDIQFFEWVKYHNKPLILVFTKVDKVTKNEHATQIKKNLAALMNPNIPFVSYSVTKNVGRKELIFEMNRMIESWAC